LRCRECDDLVPGPLPGQHTCEFSGALIASNRLDTERPGCERKQKEASELKSRHEAEVLKLWDEGLGSGQIQLRVKVSGKMVKQILLENGVTLEAIKARAGKPGRRPHQAAADEDQVHPQPAQASSNQSTPAPAPQPSTVEGKAADEPSTSAATDEPRAGTTPEGAGDETDIPAAPQIDLDTDENPAEVAESVAGLILRETRRLNMVERELENAASLVDAIKKAYGESRASTALLRTVGKVFTERLAELREAS
jgi:hypothetical protein